MSASNPTSDVLQGIMGSRMMPNPSHGDLPADRSTVHSQFALGDPALFLGIQFGSDPAVLPHEPSSILKPWLPYNSSHVSSSPAPHPLEYNQYHPPRVSNSQDAWNPLQVTGVPMNRAALNLQTGANPYQINEYIDRRSSTGQYSDPSESDSQYNGLPSGDSGYGGRSYTTRSIAASSFAVDSACSPHLTPQEREHDEKASIFELGPSGYGMIAPKTECLALPGPDDMKCHYPNCNWKGKCPSDKRKHEARHKKMFKCDEPNCSRKEGFGTINDLARHKKCVHKQDPERGPKILYMCFGYNCPRRNKRWPRLDNFRQHLARMHKDEDADLLLRRSQEWYETAALKLHDMPVSVDDQISQEVSTPQTQLSSDSDCMMADPEQDPCSSALSHESGIRLPEDEGVDSNSQDHLEEQDSDDELREPADTVSYPVGLTTLDVLNLTPTLNQTTATPQPDNPKKDHIEEFITEAATNMLSALTRMMNTNQRRHLQPTYDGKNPSNPTGELCGPKKEILQRILTAALDRLSGNVEPAEHNGLKVPESKPDKKDWIKCEFCSKRTRLRCEMKKHQKRHERPYGCTFKRCNKTFGSKADWKRHENSQHYHLQSWRCSLQDPMQGDLPCARLFYRSEVYMQHLQKDHHAGDEAAQNAMCTNRIDLNGQSRFWCGFCKKIIPLRSQGLAAWNERFNHIDVQHFRRGQRIGDWLLPSGHLTKEREWEEARREGSNAFNRADQSSSFAGENTENTENDNDDCSDSSSDVDYRDESIPLNQDEASQQTVDQNLGESSFFPQSSELQESRKRKVDTTDPMIARYWPYATDTPLAKRRFSVDDSASQARDPRMAQFVPHGCPVEDTQRSGRSLVPSHALPPYHESPYHIHRMH